MNLCVGILSLHNGLPVSPTHEAPLSAMQLKSASAAAIHSGASQLHPVDSKWLVRWTTAPTRGRLLSNKDHGPRDSALDLGGSKYSQPCVTDEREETRTTAVERPERCGERVQHRFFDNDMDFPRASGGQ
ncbi:hypothetical protein BU25DRAFT_160759 [Macroventuria anomochaeta]|uniref:Uncharacterized protein n=1 Tax=Macroventuria anomochaeta TaxID=301207 RepID=A0ACB6RRH9_9PLEO|nr:uncharacterized protein BU25DRAFT_160759 [Macroventuria anomochaeta]KAF2624394.1 hypothetical protein BU25DRAFT_160759 [Macroventuria anomochaeta]